MPTNEEFIRAITARIEEAKQRPAQSLEQWYVIVLLGGVRHAIPMSRVLEIVRTPALTPIPGAEAYVQGIFFHRGVVVPVIDIAKRFQTGSAPSRVPTHVVVIEEGHAQYGFLVDHVVDAMELRRESLREATDQSRTVSPQYLLGAWDHTVVSSRTAFQYDFLIPSPAFRERYSEMPATLEAQATTFLLSIERMVESLESDAFGVVVQ
jgi:chemotaxis signal transduction protein